MVADHIEFAYFPEATRRVLSPPYDISLVEGSITTPDDLERIKSIRADSNVLITIGACATAGGIQSLRNFANIEDYVGLVYAHPEYIQTLSTSSAIANHVTVDFELRGCPINKLQLLEVINAYLNNRLPNVSRDAVCVECKAAGNECVMVTKQLPCMGPVTQAGCSAICPSYGRACFGCYGPKENANTSSLAKELANKGCEDHQILRMFRSYNAASEPFFRESKQYEPPIEE